MNQHQLISILGKKANYDLKKKHENSHSFTSEFQSRWKKKRHTKHMENFLQILSDGAWTHFKKYTALLRLHCRRISCLIAENVPPTLLPLRNLVGISYHFLDSATMVILHREGRKKFEFSSKPDYGGIVSVENRFPCQNGL